MRSIYKRVYRNHIKGKVVERQYQYGNHLILFFNDDTYLVNTWTYDEDFGYHSDGQHLSEEVQFGVGLISEEDFHFFRANEQDKEKNKRYRQLQSLLLEFGEPKKESDYATYLRIKNKIEAGELSVFDIATSTQE